ncbi:MAG: patatin-like phospholipase family protein, partial [Polyangiales bacterium]
MSTRHSIRSLASIVPSPPLRLRDRPRTALVLAGGGARGAYEAGVLRYLCEEMPKTTGVMPWFDIVCGTSVGALNACFVASTADVLERSSSLLTSRWTEMRAENLLNVRPMEVARFMWSLFGGAPAASGDSDTETPKPHSLRERKGGLFDTRALERFVLESVPWSRISRNVAEGVVHALSVSATHVASGKTVVFVESGGALPPWSRDPHVRVKQTRITPWHALASAAIPLLFPAMPIDGTYYVDGGLRQNTPLSPALRLGADRVLVVSLKYQPEPALAAVRESVLGPLREEALPSPFFLIGKTLNALMIDRVDYDLDRMRRMNAIIDSGVDAFGPTFLDEINRRVASTKGAPLRYVRDILVRPSQDVGEIAAAYARSPAFASSGIAGRGLRRLAEAEGDDEADLLSYLLFDGGYGEELVQ